MEAALFHRLPLSWVYRDVRSLLCLLESSVSVCVCMCVFARAGAPIIIVDVRYKTTKTICTTFCCSCFFIFFSCAWRLTDVSVIAVAHKRRRTLKTRVDFFYFFFIVLRDRPFHDVPSGRRSIQLDWAPPALRPFSSKSQICFCEDNSCVPPPCL